KSRNGRKQTERIRVHSCFSWLRNSGQAGRIIITTDGRRAAYACDAASTRGSGKATRVRWRQPLQVSGQEPCVEAVAGAGGIDNIARRFHDRHLNKLTRFRTEQRTADAELDADAAGSAGVAEDFDHRLWIALASLVGGLAFVRNEEVEMRQDLR